MSGQSGFFNDGAAYERLMGRWSRRAGTIFLDWADLPKGASCLDVGCGTGAFTEELVKHCQPAAMTGVDPSSEQLAFARTRPSLAKVDFRVGSAEALPFADDSFDVGVMALVIHFLADPVKALSELARAVRPGGWAATYVWDYSVGGSPTAPIAAAMKSLGIDSAAPPSAKFTTLAALEELWRGAGLTGIETRVIRIPVTFETFDEFWDSASAPTGTSGQTIARMSREDVARLRETLRVRVPPAPDGRVAFEACANAIKARAPA